MTKTVLYIVCIVTTLAGVGCTILSQQITPADLEVKAIDYAVEAGVVDPNDFSGWQNLEKAIRLKLAVKNAYESKSLALKQMMEKNQLDYAMLNDIVVRNTEVARAREEMLFSETGLLSMGMGLLGVGGFSGMLGLFRKRPGDLTPDDYERAIGTVKKEVTDKDRQIIEIVSGVQKFLNLHKVDGRDDPTAAVLKAWLSDQSPDTKETVARIKATIG